MYNTSCISLFEILMNSSKLHFSSDILKSFLYPSLSSNASSFGKVSDAPSWFLLYIRCLTQKRRFLRFLQVLTKIILSFSFNKTRFVLETIAFDATASYWTWTDSKTWMQLTEHIFYWNLWTKHRFIFHFFVDQL